MAKTLRLYFDIASLEAAYVEEFGESAVIDIKSFKIYESQTKAGTYTEIDEKDYVPHVDYVETKKQTALDYWFKLSWVAGDDTESAKSAPLLGEYTANIIDTVAEALGDTERDDDSTIVFTDDEYLVKIRNATKRITGDKNLNGLPEEKEEMLIVLVRISACYDLAYGNCNNYPVSLPEGIALDKGQRVTHYLDVARALENQYQMMKADLGGNLTEDETIVGTPSIEVVKTTKTTYFSDTSRRGSNRY